MKFGIFDHIERRDDVGLAQQYEERLQLMELAEEAGIYSYHVAQHHHSPLCLAPNQSVFLAAAAQRTKRMRIGPLVYVLPLHQPIRLIEEVCMVDQLSDGRLDLGVGPGTGGGTELAMWGENPDPSYELFEETLDMLRTGLQSEFLTFHGKHFDVQDLWMELRPRQVPHPPLWWAGGPESAARRAANFIANGSIDQIATVTQIYRDAWETSRAGDAANVYRHADPLYGGTRRILICDSVEEARERAVTAYHSYLSHFAKPSPEGGDATKGAAGAFNEVVRQSEWFKQQQHEAAPAARPNSVLTMRMTPEQAMDSEALLVGTAESVGQYVERYVEESGANYFVGSFQWGDLTHAEASHSLDLFRKHVMPRFADVPAVV
ncbi:MAG: LLM class flavin-dependent oxidoreductase [Chloroflexi bacterium]|nr:LLM class flavin-dependent oxidoreductase [Chloroflexota bacterium]MDA1147162.1 LLM class flavin-dependent oxidoreductase [Chloroflexota bacterium]